MNGASRAAAIGFNDQSPNHPITSCLVDDSHLLPVICELLAAFEADHIMAGATGSDWFPIA